MIAVRFYRVPLPSRKPVTDGESSDQEHQGGAAVRAGRTAGRCAVALVLALAPLGALASPAAAATSAPPVVKASWYWNAKTLTTPVETLPTLPEPADAASGVPAGDLGVGYVAETLSSVDKVAAVDFDLTQIPAGSSFSSFTLTAPLDPAATQVQATPADVSACENIDVFTETSGPQDLQHSPPVALPTCVKGLLKDGAYTFDLTAIATEWSQGTPAVGITIRPTVLDTTSQRPFSIALQGKNAMKTAASWTAPVVETPVTEPVEQPVPAVVLPPLTGGGGTGGGVLPIVPDVVAPQVPGVAPQPSAAPAPQAAAFQPAAYVPRSMVPSSLWWLALLGMGAILALAWVTQSDPLVPAPADPRRQRFARAVRAAS
jgi:hypothetical protein